MKKEFSRFVIPNINMERKRMAKETQIIQYKIDDKLLKFCFKTQFNHKHCADKF